MLDVLSETGLPHGIEILPHQIEKMHHGIEILTQQIEISRSAGPASGSGNRRGNHSAGPYRAVMKASRASALPMAAVRSSARRRASLVMR